MDKNEKKIMDFNDIFKDELELINHEMSITEELYNELKEHFDGIKKSRSQGTLKFLADQAKTLISLRGHKGDLIKEKVNIKKIIADLNFKERAAEAKDGGSTTNIEDLRKILELINQNSYKPETSVAPPPSIKDEDEVDELLNERLREMGLLDDEKEDVNEEEPFEEYENDKIEESGEIRLVVDMESNIYVINEDYEVQIDYEVPEFEVTYKNIDGEIRAFDPEGNELEIIEIE